MADSRAGPGQPVVVALGSVDPALVTGVLDGHCRFVRDPGETELGLASGAIVRADVVLTPHLMGLSRRATAATFTAAARGILDVLAGREPQAVANPAWRTHRHPEEITHDQLR
jgi:phosphoglycerate dehydrogenase-like enzyme